MLQGDKAQALAAFLASLPEDMAVRLAKAVELDRLADGKLLPHDLILDGLRPVLKRVEHAERAPTPQRLFCQPFEDLLTSMPRKQKVAGRIAFSSATPVWNWLAQGLLKVETAQFVADAKADILGYRVDNAMRRAEDFWPVASAAILGALSTAKGQSAARASLGNDSVMADAREIGLMLGAGSEIVELQHKFPPLTPSLSEEHLHTLRDIYDRVIARMPDAAPYVAVVAMSRLARPWEALRLPLAVSRQTGDTLISATDMGLVGELLFADIEEHAVAVRAARQPVFDVDELVRHLAAFATLSGGLVKEVEMRRAGKWGQRLLKDRAALAEVMDDYMKRAPKEILAALPTLKAGAYAGGPRVPDVSHVPDCERSERALRYAKLIAGCRGFASAASFGAALTDVQDEIATALYAYCEDMLRELRVADGDRRAHAEQYFALAADLVALIATPEEGDFLRRRGRVALASQVAA